LGDNVGPRLIASDEDAGATCAYSISDGSNPGSAPSQGFSVTSAEDTTGAISYWYGQIKVKNPALFNFEGEASEKTFNLVVTATDETGLSDSVIVLVTVKDANEAPSMGNVVYSIPESANAPARVPDDSTQLVAQDPEGDDVTYTVTNWGEDSGSKTFDVDEDGVVNIASGRTLDHENIDQYVYTISVADPSGAASTATLTINVGDVAEVSNVISICSGK